MNPLTPWHLNTVRAAGAFTANESVPPSPTMDDKGKTGRAVNVTEESLPVLFFLRFHLLCGSGRFQKSRTG